MFEGDKKNLMECEMNRPMKEDINEVMHFQEWVSSNACMIRTI